MSAPVVPATPTVSWGPTSTLGVLLTIGGAIGTVVAAVKGNDTATAVGGASAVLTAVTTLGGRMAQAVAAVRAAATIANPWIDALQAALAATPAGSVQPIGAGTTGPSGPGMTTDPQGRLP